MNEAQKEMHVFVEAQEETAEQNLKEWLVWVTEDTAPVDH